MGGRKTIPKKNCSVYVVELADTIGPRKRFAFPNLYVGQTALDPERRLTNHLKGHRASRHVRDHGVRLRPELGLSGMTREEAEKAEAELAQSFRFLGFNVWGGH